MLSKTEAIVLHQLKFNDNNNIVHLFSREHGRIACMVSGVKSKKSSKAAYLFPLNHLNVELYLKKNRGVQRLKEMSPVFCLNMRELSFVKNTLAIFIAEFLYRIIKEEEQNHSLFSYISNSLQFFEMEDEQLSNFHLVFLLNLTKYIGIYPDNNYNAENKYFNLLSGNFVRDEHLVDNLNDKESKLLHQLLNVNFEFMSQVKLSGKIRATLLDSIINYYHSHLNSMGNFKSLDVLKQIF